MTKTKVIIIALFAIILDLFAGLHGTINLTCIFFAGFLSGCLYNALTKN